MFKFLIGLLDYIYKVNCYFCGKSRENTIMCQKCYKKIQLYDERPIKTILGVQIYACCFYADEIQRLIRGIKYHKKKDLALYQAKLMWQYFKPLVEEGEKFTIVPVPLHKKRQKKRKYNQMELVANAFAELSGWDINTTLIERTKETKPQYKLKMKEREDNLKNAFTVYPENYNNENILLIDDIFTTGSTFKEIIKTLQKNNITKITALATSTVQQQPVVEETYANRNKYYNSYRKYGK